MASADTEHQINLQDNSNENAPPPAGGKPRPQDSDALKDDSGNTAPEIKKAQEGEELSEEEYAKVEQRLLSIIDNGLTTLKPFLTMITENCEEAERKQKNDELNEEAFVDKMKPLITKAQETLQSTLDQVEAIDPDQKFQRRAKRAQEDQKASPEQQKIAKGLASLAEEVTKTIENAKKKIANMPKAKRELSPMLNMLSKPLFQILSAVGLLVVGVLNLVSNILDTLGLGGLVSGLMNGLGISSLMNSLGWKLQLTKTDDQKS